jgi:hypothetical protein
MLRKREFFGIRFVACAVFSFAFFLVIFFVRSHYDQLAERDFRLRDQRPSLKSFSRDCGIRVTPFPVTVLSLPCDWRFFRLFFFFPESAR